MECPRGCGAKVVRKDLAEHAANCAKNFKNCEICRDPVRPESAEQHRREKGELHAQILEKRLAEEVAQRRALEQRLEERGTEARLERIEQAQRDLQDAVQHLRDTSQRDLQDSVRDLQDSVRDLRDAAPRRKVEWRFTAADMLAWAPARGDKMKSDTFSLLGAGDMRFMLYPRGSDIGGAATANNVHIYIEGAFEVTGRLSMLSTGVEVGGWVWDTPQDISCGLSSIQY